MNKSILLGKKDPAPRNRGFYLTREDIKQFSGLKSINNLRADVSNGSHMNSIYCADALKALGAIPKSSVDLIFADPPYNLGKDFGNNIDRRSYEEYRKWNSKWIGECGRILKPGGSAYICCDWKYSGMFQKIISKHFIIRNRITWKREKGRGSKSNWKNNMEDIWFATAGDNFIFNVDEVKIKKEIIAPYKVNGKPKDWLIKNGEKFRMTYPSNIWVDLVVPFWSMRENTPHPTQKPEKLLERIILASSNKGHIVLDPFMGSGTTAAVCKKLERNFIGFEINEQYVVLTAKRLK